MPKGNRTGLKAQKSRAARKAVMKKGVSGGSANKRKVKNISSDTSKTRMHSAKRRKAPTAKNTPRTYYGGQG